MVRKIRGGGNYASKYDTCCLHSLWAGIAYGDGPGIEFLWEARFSAPIQNGPGAQPASYTMCTGSLPGGKAVGAWR